MTTSVRRTRAIDGVEHDVVCPICRKTHTFGPGVTKSVKTKINRRERSVAKQQLRNSDTW